MTRDDAWITNWPPTTRFTPHPDWQPYALIPRPIVDHAMWIGLLGVAVTGTCVLAGIQVWRALAAPVDEIGD